MSRPLRVVYTGDENYAMPLAVSMRSLVDNCADVDALAVTLLTHEFSGDSLDLLRKSCPELTLDVVRVPDATLAGLPTVSYFSTAIYLRLLIPELLAGDDPVVYVDADTVVLADLHELSGTPLQGRPVGAVLDPGVPRVDAPDGVRRWAELGLAGDTPYFNDGIMLVDPQRWRDLRVTGKTLAYVRAYGDQIKYPDQEALNVVLRGDWLPLDPAWNMWTVVAGAAFIAKRLGVDYPLTPEYARAIDQPKIVHFVGEDKPWLKVAMRGPFSRFFYHYLDRTAWSGWRPQ
jgi:lipopolysaccharide biosynthesis glycosyltransferase